MAGPAFAIEAVVKGLTEAHAKVKHAEKQMRFAVSVALNETGRRAQQELVARTQRTFTLRSTWYKPGAMFGLNFYKSTKTNLTARIMTRAWWIVQHEPGATRKGWLTIGGQKFYPVPTRFVWPNRAAKNPFPVKRLKSKAAQRRTFVGIVGTTFGVWLRPKRPGEPTLSGADDGSTFPRLLYALLDEVTIKAVYEFKDTGTLVASRWFAIELERAVRHAIATAR